jgi:hypothetical protein
LVNEDRQTDRQEREDNAMEYAHVIAASLHVKPLQQSRNRDDG